MFEVAVSMQIISLLTCMSNIYIEHAKSIKYADPFHYEGIVGVWDLLWKPCTSSPLNHIIPVDREDGIRGLVPKYKLGLYVPHNNESFKALPAATFSCTSCAVRL